MKVSKEQIEEFKRIFKKQYSRKLSTEEARETIYNFIGFFYTLFKSDIEKNPEEYEKDN